MGEVDPAFIQEPDHRPNPSLDEAKEIPLIDLFPFIDSHKFPTSIDALVSEIRSACKNWGFFQVINHGVPSEIRKKLFDVSRKFFAQPLEEKLKVRRNQSNVLGYFESEHTKNVRDWKEVFDFAVNDPATIPASPDPEDSATTQCFNQWPENPPELRGICEEYAKEMKGLAEKLMELIALSLGLKQNMFEDFFKDQTASFIRARLNHYPPCPTPDLALGVGRHKDTGALIILAQDDVSGLQVKRKSDGEWVRVRPVSDAFTVNVGDVIQVWSNDIYESVEHRVTVNPEKDRYSVPFVFNPPHYYDVKPLEKLINEENPTKYRPYNWGKFFAARRASNFRKLGFENLQIRHFRIPDSEFANRFGDALVVRE